jgi:hypothetical protein
MTTRHLPRERLPNRRPSETFDFQVEGLRYYATVSHLADGRIGEIFIGNHKVGSQCDTNVRDTALAASLALQHGCALDVLRGALLRDVRGMATTPLGWRSTSSPNRKALKRTRGRDKRSPKHRY